MNKTIELQGRTLEKDVIFPAMVIIAEHRAIKMSDLADKLEMLFRPEGGDAKILHNRNDKKIRQIIRNLVSHRKLDKLGLANYDDKTGYIKVTAKGVRTVSLLLRVVRG